MSLCGCVILKGFLEARANEGSVDPHVHNGLAKIYVDTNNACLHKHTEMHCTLCFGCLCGNGGRGESGVADWIVFVLSFFILFA